MKKLIFTILAILGFQISALGEEIHFDNEIYKLKFSALAPLTKGYGNEYFKGNENVSDWSKMIGIYYYPSEDNPLEFAQDFDQIVDDTDNSMLLKLVENKKTNQAVMSFLVNNSENGKKYFEYDVYKFEKHPAHGMVLSKYASKHYFKNDADITKLAQQIKENNDKYLELLIISPTPNVVEKDIAIGN